MAGSIKILQAPFSSQAVAKAVKYVPKHKPATSTDLDRLTEFVSKARNMLVLTGAGVSTESGIPDYRSEGVGLYARSNSRPVQYMTFLKSAEARQRYWARNYVGWPIFSSFKPNDSHSVLTLWERKGIISWLVTQNVDSLHYKAGSQKVTELHGSSSRVMCLSCTNKLPRAKLQLMFKDLNPDFTIDHTTQIAPDGDVLLSQEQVEGFKVPDCPSCGGVLKPDIVFFGDNVAKDIVNFVFRQVDQCDRVLVAGSSLQVYSGYRFVNRAKEQGKPIAIVNIGPTRADDLASIKIDARCGELLPAVNYNLYS